MVVIFSGFLFPNVNLTSASIPISYDALDSQDDIVLYFYNSTSGNYMTRNTTSEYHIDILSLSYSFDEEVDNFTISLELDGTPLVNGSNYYRIQLISENATSRFSINIQFGVPSGNLTNSIYEIGAQGNLYELETYAVTPRISENTISWPVRTSPVFDTGILLEDPSIVITSFSAVVERYLNISYYYHDMIEVEDIQSNAEISSSSSDEELFDIIDPVAVLIFLVVPLIIIVYFIIRRRSIY